MSWIVFYIFADKDSLCGPQTHMSYYGMYIFNAAVILLILLSLIYVIKTYDEYFFGGHHIPWKKYWYIIVIFSLVFLYFFIGGNIKIYFHIKNQFNQIYLLKFQCFLKMVIISLILITLMIFIIEYFIKFNIILLTRMNNKYMFFIIKYFFLFCIYCLLYIDLEKCQTKDFTKSIYYKLSQKLFERKNISQQNVTITNENRYKLLIIYYMIFLFYN